MEQVQNKTIHITHCPTEEMVADFFTKPLQGSLFTKMRNYVMGNEEPAYQVLPRSVLGNDNSANIRSANIWKLKTIGMLKTIGTRKHNSEGAEITKHVKDSDASSIHPSGKNTQGTSSSMCGSGGERMCQPGQQGGGAEQHDDATRKVEPRSYRDVVVSG